MLTRQLFTSGRRAGSRPVMREQYVSNPPVGRREARFFEHIHGHEASAEAGRDFVLSWNDWR